MKNPKRLSVERLNQILNHNMGYIDMIFRDGGSSYAEERMIESLSPLVVELNTRKRNATRKRFFTKQNLNTPRAASTKVKF